MKDKLFKLDNNPTNNKVPLPSIYQSPHLHNQPTQSQTLLVD